MNLEQLKHARAELLNKADALRNQFASEGKPMTTEAIAEFRGLLDQCDSLSAQIQEIERLDTAIEQTTRRQERPGVAATVHDRAEDKPFASFGEQLMAVRRAAESRRMDFDPRLRKLDLSDVQVRAAAGLSEGVASDGGFLVGTDMGALLQKAIFETGMVSSRARKVPISTVANGISIPYPDETSRVDGSRWGGVRAYWQNEVDSTTGTKPKFGVLKLGLSKLMALVYTTDELLQDAAALESIVRQAVTEELAFKVDDAIIRGTGAGVPLGILNASATVSVAKQSGQAAATIVYENISKMRLRMPPRSFRNAVWFVNQDTLGQLEKLFIPVTNVAGTENVGGTSVYVPPGGASAAPFGALLGRPVIEIEQCETLGTVGDIVLADLGMYLLAEKGGVQAASSIHVNFTTDETAFRFIMRTDGQPMVKSAITPYKGTATLSPFVTLATRA